MNSRASRRAIGGNPTLTLTEITPTARAGEAERPPRRPLFGQLQLCARRRQPGAEPARRLSAAAGRRRCGSIRRPSNEPAFPPTGDLVSVPSIPIPGRSEYRLPIALPAPRPPRSRGVQSERRPRLEPGHRRPPRRHLGAAAQDRGRRLGPHALRHLSRLLSSAVRSSRSRAAIMRRFYHRCEVVHGAGRIDRRDPARAADEPRHRDLGARHRPRAVQPRAPRHGMAPLARHCRRRDGHRLPRPGRDGKGPRRLRRRDPRLRDARAQAPRAGHRRRTGAAMVRGAAARRDLHSAS